LLIDEENAWNLLLLKRDWTGGTEVAAGSPAGDLNGCHSPIVTASTQIHQKSVAEVSEMDVENCDINSVNVRILYRVALPGLTVNAYVNGPPVYFSVEGRLHPGRWRFGEVRVFIRSSPESRDRLWRRQPLSMALRLKEDLK
jgi:hypothetical protein